MYPALAIALGVSAGISFYSFHLFNLEGPIPKEVIGSPSRQTAYKIAIIGMKICCLWSGLNLLVTSGRFTYLTISSIPNVAALALAKKIMIHSNTLVLGTLGVSFSCLLYARRGHVFEAP